VITDQAAADARPAIEEGYKYQHTNEAVVYVNKELALGYAKMDSEGGEAVSPTIELTHTEGESTPGFGMITAVGAVALLAAKVLSQKDEEK
jgi:hypothetical protein